ncbi:MAG: hypothetical protein ACRDMX_13600, partial [Solirubrobacteraceae bacterium]
PAPAAATPSAPAAPGPERSSAADLPAPGADAGAPATPANKAAANAAAPPKEPELDAIAACWPAVLDLVRQDNAMLAALLADARPVALAGHDVTVAFPAGKAFLKRKAEQDDYRRAAAEALRAVIGSPLALRYELREQLDEGGARVDGELSHDELVRRLVDEFDAREVLDDDQEGAE